MEVITGIAIGVVLLFTVYNTITNNRKIKAIQDKMQAYESLYKKHLAGKVVAMKESPDPNDEICPDAESIQ